MSDPAVTPLGDGRYLVQRADGRSTVAFAAVSNDGTWVFVDGEVFLVESDERKEIARHADDPSALSAPMPATVVAINASPGGAVSAGDVVVLLEAMKMELPVKAPRDGVVRRIHCRVGELVQPGVPLIELA